MAAAHGGGAAPRSRATSARDARLEAAILERLAARRPGVTICPSEVARALAPDDDAWRALMEPVRAAAARLADRGAIEVLQRGARVDVRHARGPVRLRLAHAREMKR